MELSEKAREAQREYMRQWRARNREKVNEYNKRWNSDPGNKEKRRDINNRYWENKAARNLEGAM